jgi:hypothetical protein
LKLKDPVHKIQRLGKNGWEQAWYLKSYALNPEDYYVVCPSPS